jgi:signal transduction histidine kinase
MHAANVFRARAFRIAVAFSLAVSLATAAVFGLVYYRLSRADVEKIGAVLTDEAAKSVDDDEARLQRALQLRLTRDLRRLDYVALFSPGGALAFGNVGEIPGIPIDGRAHFVTEERALDDSENHEPAMFVARRRANGGVLLLGRNLREVYDLEESVLTALGAALLPSCLLTLGIGLWFARRASRRVQRLRWAVTNVIQGQFATRLPIDRSGDEIDSVAGDVNVMLDEIARLLDQLKSVGDNIAHDLRAPLMAARAKIERALEEWPEDDPMAAKLSGAIAQLDRAAVTIEALLRISAIETGARKKSFADFDLAALCGQLFDFYDPVARSKAIVMSVDAAAPTPMRGDENLMREAISNLVDNAIKFTPAGGEVRLEARTDNGQPLVRVSDTGCGVPLQEREKIFRRFYRVRNGANEAGNGLGLSIAQTIANLHGFEFVVEDNHPGARFELRPVAKAAPPRRAE